MDTGNHPPSPPDLIAQDAGLGAFGPGFGPQSMREVVFRKIALQIASGMLRVGDALPGERGLADAFGVSRETVRGAVQMLAARGLVDVAQGARTRVISDEVGAIEVGVMRPREVNRYDLDQVHAARQLLEQQVVGDAAERIDEATLARLRVMVAEQSRVGADSVRFMLSDREFHSTIYLACGNLLMAELVMDLYTYMIALRRSAMAEPGAIARSTGDHRQILAGLEARDRAAVQAAFAGHLDNITRTTKAILARGADTDTDTSAGTVEDGPAQAARGEDYPPG